MSQTKPSIVFAHGIWASARPVPSHRHLLPRRSHVPMLSNPRLVLDVIRAAAHGV
jgi:hypothetical protein